jgi:predicted RNase H-like HicB family nuclease
MMKEYLVIYERAGSRSSAYVPDLPGCVGAGDSKEDASRLIREAIEFHIDGLKEEGLPVPEPKADVERVRVAA